MRSIIRSLVLFVYRSINVISNFIAEKLNASYQIILPYATYAPWIVDKPFWNLYKRVKNNTLVWNGQGYELWQMVEETHQLAGDIIEVGTWRGASLMMMATKAAMMQSSSVVYGCDTFEGVVKASEQDKYYKGGEHDDTSEEYVYKLATETFQLTNVKLLKGIFPEDTGKLVANNQFRLCHIDVDTYQSGKDVFDWIWGKMVVGGVIVFNDYAYPNTNGITKLVNDQRNLPDRIVLHNLNGNGLVIKIK